MPGAAVPSDADAIVPLEQTDLGTAIGETPPQWIVVTSQEKLGSLTAGMPMPPGFKLPF